MDTWEDIAWNDYLGTPEAAAESDRRFDQRYERERRCRWQNRSGYWLIAIDADDPLASMARWNPDRSCWEVLEHRYVAARYLMLRPLTAWYEIVHHIDGDRSNNRPSNLQVLHRFLNGPGHAHRCEECGSERIAHAPIRLPEWWSPEVD